MEDSLVSLEAPRGRALLRLSRTGERFLQLHFSSEGNNLVLLLFALLDRLVEGNYEDKCFSTSLQCICDLKKGSAEVTAGSYNSF